jgi:small-conductance mechanosensitive channel
MAYFVTMLGAIAESEVVPSAYDKFVNYIVANLKPSSNTVAKSFATELTTSIKVSIVFMFVLAIFVILLIILIFVDTKKQMNNHVAICVFVISLSIAAVLFLACCNVSGEIATAEAYKFQDTVSEATLYALNSSLRDTIYLTLCK